MTSEIETEDWKNNSKHHWGGVNNSNPIHDMFYDWESFFKGTNFDAGKQLNSMDLECSLLSLRCFIYYIKTGRINIDETERE